MQRVDDKNELTLANVSLKLKVMEMKSLKVLKAWS